jgi:hypothetical protein
MGSGSGIGVGSGSGSRLTFFDATTSQTTYPDEPKANTVATIKKIIIKGFT